MPRPTADHIVDVLIAERAPRLTGSAAWPLVKPALYRLLDYRKACAMADAIAPMGGREAMAYFSERLDLKVEATGLERVPRSGPMVAAFNHPTGLADGVAVHDALQPVRPDILFYANADAHRISPRLDEVLIPVEWVEAKRTRERTRLTLKLSQEALAAGRALAVAPAGRISRRQPDGSLRDPAWHPTAVSLARRHGAPVVPMHLAGPWSFLFHGFHRVSQELRDITLFHELLNKRGRRFRLTVGPIVPPSALSGDAAEVTSRLKTYIETILPHHPDRPFA